MDTVVRLQAGARSIRFICEQQKDGEPFDDINLGLRVLELDGGVTLCIVVASSTVATPSPSLSDVELRVLRHSDQKTQSRREAKQHPDSHSQLPSAPLKGGGSDDSCV